MQHGCPLEPLRRGRGRPSRGATRTLWILLWACLAWRGAGGAPTDAYNVVWDSPSANHHGSMPLGNGDVAANAWATADGDLHFYISKTDAWDDYARLLKVGKVTVHFEPNPFPAGRRFRQTLDLATGTLRIEAGEGSGRHIIELWVDANHPVIQVTAAGAEPFEATAQVVLWRTNQVQSTDVQVSDVLLNRKSADQKQEPMLLEPDTLLPDLKNRVGWCHHNVKSVGHALLAELQGLTGFAQPDPILHRTFGAVVTGEHATRLDPSRLRSPRATSHRFSVFVLTRQPSTPESWLADVDRLVQQVRAHPFEAQRAAHVAWWTEFWQRSWIRAFTNPSVTAQAAALPIVPTNSHPVRLGTDQGGGNVFAGQFGRVSVFDVPLAEGQIDALAKLGPDRSLAQFRATAASGLQLPDPRFTATGPAKLALPGSVGWDFARGLSLEVWVKPTALPEGGARLVDKITPGGSDGFLLDTFPGNSLRFICGADILQQDNALPADRWTHVAAVSDPSRAGCRVYVNGRLTLDAMSAKVGDEAADVSQMYHLQRFITACAGRGAYPIKFNGSLFTVPPGPTEKDPDYRRWGPGYWWQNTRLPYISLCTSGDFDLQRPLFRMYADELLPICRYRTRHYLGHGGAYYPECLMFWGAVFSDTYGWTPFDQRQDKLQESGWHKWEWVSGLELAWMMLDYHSHTSDRDFLRHTAIPFAREVLQFFDEHYPTNPQGKLVMHPSQALETWWQCTNATPELAGCVALTTRLLALPAEVTPASDRGLWERLQSKLPPIPLRQVEGRQALAPATTFAQKSNIENPELYPVFPFRLFAFNRPDADWALEALRHRWDRGNHGWRQDDIFMAYLGLADEARRALVDRARSHDRGERFPAFWGPNYDWTPDQDHGGVLMKTLQSMLLQSDGAEVFLLPAWPTGWDVDFKLHAPQQTIVEGRYRNGNMVSLRVTPDWRKANVKTVEPAASNRR